MYLRSTKRGIQDGTEVDNFQLAHNVSNPRTGKPLAQIIHNFGRADQVCRNDFYVTTQKQGGAGQLVFKELTLPTSAHNFHLDVPRKKAAWSRIH